MKSSAAICLALVALQGCSQQTVQEATPAQATPPQTTTAAAPPPAERTTAPAPAARTPRTARAVPQQPAVLTAPASIPTGQSTPEGVACDAVQAYIRANGADWLATLVRPIYGESDYEYESFKVMMVDRAEAHRQDPAYVPPRIVRVCKAREFSIDRPRAAALANHGFTGNMFVDIYLEVPNSGFQRLRYHVLKDTDGRWYFDPRPDLNTQYSSGINEESQSEDVVWQEP
jgi:hypothetical protein